jgi:hypothetical protein
LVDTLAVLRDALRARDRITRQLEELDARVIPAGGDTKKRQSQMARLAAQLSTVDSDIKELHDVLAREIEASGAIVGGAENELTILEERHASGAITDASYDKQVRALGRTISAGRARREIRERAQRAESAAGLNWLASIPADQRKPDRLQQIGESDVSDARVPDWPGASVPERVQMLWREGKKSHSRRPIIISGIVVGVMALIVVGLVIVSNFTSDKTAADYLGEGDVLVPVLVDNMQDVRNLDFTIQYDPQSVTAMSVIQDEVGRLSVMEYDINEGQLTVSLRDVTGITGTGAVVIVRFKANQSVAEQAALQFASVSATDVSTLEDRPVLGIDGWIDTATLEVSAPVLAFPEQ